MRTFWTGATLFAIAELFLSSSMFLIKFFTGTNFGYELTVKFADPTGFFKNQEAFFPVLAIFSVFLAWLADSFIGKSYISIGGISFLLLSSLYWSMIVYEAIESEYLISILVMLYMSTSSIRIALILEQIVIPDDIKDIRNYIFCLTMIKVVTSFVCHSLVLFEYDGQKYLRILCFLVLSLLFVYLIFLILIIKYINIESTYFQIWFLACKCVAVALKKIRDQKKLKKKSEIKLKTAKSTEEMIPTDVVRTSKKDAKFEDEQRPEIAEPKENWKKWGLKVIVTEKKVEPEPSPEPSSPKDSKPETEEIPDESVVQTYFKWFLSFLPIRPQEKVQNLPPPKTPQKLPEKLPEKLHEKHWIYNAYPKMTLFVARQTRLFYSSIFIVVPSSLLGHLIYFVLFSTKKQVPFMTKKHRIVEWGSIDLMSYSLIFDVVLFPFFELLVHPLFKKKKLLDLTYISIGYGVALASLIACFTVQLTLEKSLQYLPNENAAQVRFFNLLVSTSTISSHTFGVHRIPFLEAFDTSIFVHKEDKINVRFFNDESKLNQNLGLTFKGGKCISYVITSKGVKPNSESDPTIFSNETVDKSYFFLVDNLPKFSNRTYKYLFENGKNATFEYVKGRKYGIDPGVYRIVLIAEGGEYEILNLKKVELRDSSLYALVLYILKISSKKFAFDGKLILLEGPLTLSLERVLAQIFLASLANAIASVSLIRFLLVESPKKLRSATFTFVFAFNVIALFVFEKIFINLEPQIRFSKVILIYGIAHLFLFILTVYFSTQFEYSHKYYVFLFYLRSSGFPHSSNLWDRVIVKKKI